MKEKIIILAIVALSGFVLGYGPNKNNTIPTTFKKCYNFFLTSSLKIKNTNTYFQIKNDDSTFCSLLKEILSSGTIHREKAKFKG